LDTNEINEHMEMNKQISGNKKGRPKATFFIALAKEINLHV